MDKKYKIINSMLGNNPDWIRINTLLIQRIGLKEAILMNYLLIKYLEVARKNKLKDGMFYVSYKNIYEGTSLKEKQVHLAIKNLEKLNLIESSPVKDGVTVLGRNYKINKDVYDSFLKDGTGNICANVINDNNYVIYNRKIAKKYGPVTAIVYTYLYNNYMEHKKNDDLIEGLWFIESHGNLGKKIGVSRQTIITEYMPQLIKDDLIWTCTMNKGNFTHISINEAKLFEILGLKDLFNTDTKK